MRNLRLKSRREITRLFTPGAGTLKAYPLRLVFRPVEKQQGDATIRVAYVVPKRKFKRAVDRNLLKRRMREAYRLNADLLQLGPGTPQLALMIMYTGREIQPYATIERKLKKLLPRIA
jgi:ribonuclease P protein component